MGRVSVATVAESAPLPLKTASLLAAMGKSGGATLASGLLSAAAIKAIAVGAGPASVAILASLQQARQAGLVAATANGQTAFVQGARALTGRSRREYVRTVACVMALLTLFVSTLFVGLFVALAWLGEAQLRLFAQRLTAHTALAPSVFAWLAVPVVLSSCFVFLSGLLNALGAVGSLAAIQVAASLAMLIGAPWAARQASGDQGLALVGLIAFSAAVSVAAAARALYPFRNRLREWVAGPGRWWSPTAAGHFLSIAGAMSLSGLVATMALFAVRGQITAKAGLQTTGQWDAAWNVSMNHASLVLASLQTHYLPALAGARNKAERSARLSAVLAAGSVVAALAIACIALTKPLVLAGLYSPAFRPAASYLRWTLLGDYLKVSSWIASIPMLAAADMKFFLLADLLAYLAFVAVAALLGPVLGAATAACIGFVAMYAIHLLVCAVAVRNRHGLRLSRQAVVVWMSGLTLVCAASAIGWNQI